MLNDSEFLEKMWFKVKVIEREEKINKEVFERNKKIKYERIKDYIYTDVVAIILLLAAICISMESIIIIGLILMETIYYYENKNMKNINVGGI